MSNLRTIAGAIALVWAASGCANDATRQPKADASPRVDTRAPSDSLRVLIDSLSTLTGSFVQQGSPSNFVFSGDRALFHRIAGYGDAAVRELVECLDRTELATARLAGRRVYVGVMCSEALTYTATYEATDTRGDLDPSWPGYVLPDATPEQLEQAKAAWLDVLARKAYVLTSS